MLQDGFKMPKTHLAYTKCSFLKDRGLKLGPKMSSKRASWMPFGASLGAFGGFLCVLGPSWGLPGAFWQPRLLYEVPKRPPRGLKRHPRSHLGSPLGLYWGRFGIILVPFGDILGSLGAFLWPFWGAITTTSVPNDIS